MNEISMVILLGLLVIAAWCDVGSYRIPNKLILIGIICGLLLQFLAHGWAGLMPAMQGLLIGIAVLLPMYFLRAMGAGDVKLMGMVGVFLGPGHVLGAWLVTLLVGGVLALLLAQHYKKLHLMLLSMKGIMMDTIYKCSSRQMPTIVMEKVSAGQLPYGVSIALGTALYLVWQHGVS